MFPVQDIQTGRIKYTGVAKAVVTDNKDPQTRGRIKVTHPILGDTAWIEYLQLPFAFDVPELGDIVYVQCDGGFETHPIAWGKIIAPSSENTLPSVFERTIPTNRGMYTPGGHLIELDDGDGITTLGKGIRFTSAGESIISITEDTGIDDKVLIQKNGAGNIEIDGTLDTIKLTTNQGQFLNLVAGVGTILSSNSGDKVTLGSGTAVIESATGTIITLDEVGLDITDPAGNNISTDVASIELTDVTGNTVQMLPDGVLINTAAGAQVLIEATGTTILDAAGSGMKTSPGQIAIGTATVEVMDILSQICQNLSTAATPGFGGPLSNAPAFAALQIQVDTAKGSL